ncbi:hypothetical protein ACVV62_08685 [Streptococcus pluranimalium]
MPVQPRGLNKKAFSSTEYHVKYYNVEGDEILGLFSTTGPGAVERNNALRGAAGNISNKDVALTSFGVRFITNFKDQDTRSKEMRYVFPKNDNFKVRGFMLPQLKNDYAISTIQVSSVEKPELRTVKLPQIYTWIGDRTTCNVTIDVRPQTQKRRFLIR